MRDFSMCIRKITVLLVGLDNAGKTCTLKSIMKGNLKLINIYYKIHIQLIVNYKLNKLLSFRKAKKYSFDCWVFVFQM